ncbi:glycosyltransferase family 2 protein [Streptacidiphilus monticola]
MLTARIREVPAVPRGTPHRRVGAGMASRLSVVVPIFNVEPYLDECLASLATQTMGDFEVVMVDDGSTDGSAEIARAWEARDGRFRLVRKENAGLGPARNTGIEHISPESEFLAFVDSDDTLPPHAYELMLDTLDRTGSDFATGNVLRFRSTDHHQSPVHRRPFARTRLETHVSEFPPLITDRTAWNKVYRRSFWERHRLQYPPILYEDAPVSIPLHFLAEKVDVLAEHIYNWRERDSGTQSITQNRTNPQGLIDRVASIGMVREFLRNQADPRFDEFRHRYDRNALVEEIPLFFKPLRIAGAEFRTAYLDHVGRLVADIGPKTLNALPQPMRLKYYLTVKRRLDELLAMLEFERTYPYTIPMHGTLRPAADYPFLRAPVPAAVLRLDQELVVRTGLRSAQWTADGRLELTGFAYPRHAGATRPREALKMLVLRESGGRRRLAVPARTVRDPRITAEAWGQALRDCDYGGFEAHIDPARLKRRGRWVDGMWRVTVGVLGPGRPRRSRLKGGPFDAGANPPARWVSERVRVVPEIHDAHLYLHVETVHAVADAAAPAADGFEIRGRLDAELAAQAELLVLQCQEDGGAAVQVAGRLEVGRVDDGWAPSPLSSTRR